VKGKPNSAAKFKIRKENKMEIREEMKDWVGFREIRWGDVFSAEDGDYCMRVSGSAEYNAVRVGTGQLVHIGGGELVSPVHNAKMVVNF
jgi:hypothetical protein